MLRELIIGNGEKVPKGWMTTKQWAKQETGDENKIGMMSKYLKIGVERGLIEMKHFTIKTGSRVLPVPHYRLKV